MKGRLFALLAAQLLRDWNVWCRCISELHSMARAAGFAPVNKARHSLADLCSLILKRELPKGRSRLSKWDSEFLDQEQVRYACADAEVSMFLFRVRSTITIIVLILLRSIYACAG